jgi:hypothetical protein
LEPAEKRRVKDTPHLVASLPGCDNTSMSEDKPKTPQQDFPPAEDAYEDGVDVSLIRYMLSLTPKERLEMLQNNVNAILKIRKAKDES